MCENGFFSYTDEEEEEELKKKKKKRIKVSLTEFCSEVLLLLFV